VEGKVGKICREGSEVGRKGTKIEEEIYGRK
jgi:hypothetical protein